MGGFESETCVGFAREWMWRWHGVRVLKGVGFQRAMVLIRHAFGSVMV
jgi:hypothetical protein